VGSGEVRDGARFDQGLADEQPAGAGLDGDVDLLAGEALHPTMDSGGGRGDAALQGLPRREVEGIEGDLRSVKVEAGSGICHLREFLAVSGGAPWFMPSLREGRARRLVQRNHEPWSPRVGPAGCTVKRDGPVISGAEGKRCRPAGSARE